jgi:tetratricopeptide (TPR) repeat protein
MDKIHRLLELSAKAYELEQTFIAGLSGEERSEIGTFERWCAKDVIAHNASWKSRLAENLLAVTQGTLSRQTEEYNHENAEFYKEHCQKTWEEVLLFANQAYRDFSDQIAAISKSALEHTDLLPWQEGRPLWRLAIGNGYSHPVVHVAEYHRDRGRKELSAAILGEMVRQSQDFDDSPTWQGIVKYNLACQLALLDQPEQAIAALRLALASYPALAEYALHDSDLASLRGDAEFQALVAVS